MEDRCGELVIQSGLVWMSLLSCELRVCVATSHNKPLNSGDWNRIKRYTSLLSIPGQLVATATLLHTREFISVWSG